MVSQVSLHLLTFCPATACHAVSLALALSCADTNAAQVRYPDGETLTSVCGEPCDIQVCKTCATDDQLDELSDLIMQATLRDTLADEPDTRLITLECGHIFTVETLDGTLRLSECYTQDPESGKWTGLLTAEGFQRRIACPSCRASITSPRYNRSTKRVLLDIQEQVAIMRYGAQVGQAASELARPSAADQSSAIRVTLNKTNLLKPGAVKFPDMRRKLFPLGKKDDKCIAPDYFQCAIPGLFGIDGAAGQLWQKFAGRTLQLYRLLSEMANSHRMPHTVAYEGAMSSIYWNELMIARESSVSATRDPSQAALLTARRRLGAPPPGGEARFKIEALLQTIHARLKLASIASKISEELRKDSAPKRVKGKGKAKADSDDRHRRSVWRQLARAFDALATGLLWSAQRDATLAARMATKNKMPRLVVDSHVISLRVEFEEMRHKIKGEIYAAENHPRADERRGRRFEAAENAEEECLGRLEKTANAFMMTINKLPLQHPENTALPAHIAKLRPYADSILGEWKKFAEQIDSGVWYESVSLQEKEAIIRATMDAGFGTAGRFYQCPNGHPFTVGQCGQTMQEARCPECGAGIGGRNHQLRSDNTRDQELEAIARNLGGARNPY